MTEEKNQTGWSGVERRRDMPDIISRLVKLETLQERDINEAEGWRKIFCDKIEKLTNLVTNLPCDKREGRWLSVTIQIRWLWIAIMFIMTVLTGITFTLIMRIMK